MEIGKRNIISEAEMTKRRPDVQYFTYTLNEMIHDRPEELRVMLHSLTDHFESGAFKPLRYEVFEFQNGLIEGFKRLRDGTNIGKVVIRLQTEPNIGTALITGGLGGLGLITAELLYEMGAEHIVLVSRSGKAKNYEGQDLEIRLSKLLKAGDGICVSIECCDMSNEGEVQSLLKRVRENHGTINTIVHASGVLDDSLLQSMTMEAVGSSFGPKAAGAWYLHKHTVMDEVRHFIAFSSIAALFGNPGQANYSASNSYLDSLVRLRRNKGLPAASIQWPAIADVGMAAANEKRMLIKDKLSLSNVRRVLKEILTSQLDDWEAVSSPIPRAMLRKDHIPTKILPFMSDVMVETTSSERMNSKTSSVTRKGPRKGWGIGTISSEVEEAVREVISIGSSQTIDHHASLMDMGLDSLGTTELSESLQSKFSVDLPLTFVFNNPTIASMSQYLVGVLQPESAMANDGHLKALRDRPSPEMELAIVGMGCRFPGGVASLKQYWELICAGDQTSSNIPFERWDVSSLTSRSDLNEKEKMQVSHGSFVNDMEFFDPSIFRISKAEAEEMSPAQRILLECSFLALLDAGFAPSEMKGLDCGVFVGATSGAFERPSNLNTISKRSSVYSATGSSASIASGRISYVFNFQGPNAVYDTACSSSLVALDAAISALQANKCEMALVAGANELFDSKIFESFARAGMLSPTGQCHTWDESADG